MNREIKTKENLICVLLAIGVFLIVIRDVSADFVFSVAENLGPTINTSLHEAAPEISSDFLSLRFVRLATWDEQGEWWLATRATKNAPWDTPVNLGQWDDSLWDFIDIEPGFTTSDGLELYFSEYDRDGGFGGVDIWMMKRETREDKWDEPVNLGSVVNSTDNESWPTVSPNGLELYFYADSGTSVRPGGYGRSDLWVTRRATRKDPWSEAMNLGPTINSQSRDLRPSISSDGLLLFFDSDRLVGYDRSDLYVARRSSLSKPWEKPMKLGPFINRPECYQECARVSADGSTLFWDSDIPEGYGGHDIWQASILPIVDLNSDGVVNDVDICIMIDHWGEDSKLCDIGPMPWGDGVVDAQDLIVISEHLFSDMRLFVDDDAPNDPGLGDPLVSDPMENGSADHPFDSIQEAIDAALPRESIAVLPGTYRGDGNRDLTFRGKAIAVHSIDPTSFQIIAATIIDCQGTENDHHRGFVFNTSESYRSVLKGLTITNGYSHNGGVITCISDSSPTISSCIFRNNTAVEGGGVIANYYGNPIITNCIFFDNTADEGGVIYNRSELMITNSTFSQNSATLGGAVYTENKSLDLVNCILWDNTPEQIHSDGGTVSVTYSDIQNGWDGEGNIDTDPLFVNIGNCDYHLKSQAGRWNPDSESWIHDDVTSPCIDAGNPSTSVVLEPSPNGDRINIGAFGGTTEASKTP